MPGFLTLTIKPPFRDIKGRFAKAEKGLLDDRREMVRTLGRRYVGLAKQEAPKRTGRFASKLIYRTFQRGNVLGFNAYSPEPLGTFIRRGTSPHIIAARSAGALYFYWPKVGMFTVVPKAGGFKTHVAGGKLWIGKGFVNHPGTKENDYQVRAYDQWKPEARPALRQISLRYIARLQG